MRVSLRVGRTSIKAEGQMGGVWNLKRIDAKVSVSGPSLATLYPTLPLALPDTPPYRISGHLIRDGDVYTYENFSGVIGNTDLSGDARYELRQPRPMLTAALKSRSLDLADLGPSGGLPRRQDASATAAPAKGRPPPAKLPPGKVFPDNDFNLEKLNAMDADVRLNAFNVEDSRRYPPGEFFHASEAQRGRARARPT